MAGRIYLILSPAMNAVKIGYTKGDPLKRMAQLQTGAADELQLIDCRRGCLAQEGMYHEAFKDWHIRGEWFHWSKQLHQIFARVSDLSNGIPTKPPMTECGFDALKLTVRLCGGARSRYPDGTRHNMIDWDEVSVLVDAADYPVISGGVQ